MKKVLLLAALVMIFIGSFGFAENGIYDDKVVIGSFQALSGPIAFIGMPMANGMKAYFNWVNENGGVYGRKIELLIADDQFTPSKTVVEVKRLVEQDKVFAIVGGLGTPGCLAVMNYLNESKVPFVYQGSGALQLSVPPNKYIFSVQPNYYSVEGPIVAKYLTQEKKFNKIAVVYRAADDGKEELAGIKKYLADNDLSKVLVKEIPVNPSATSFDNEIIELLSADVQAIFLSMYGQQTPNFLKQSKEYGLEALFATSYPNADISVITLSEGAAEGAQAMAWVWLGDPESEEYLNYLSIYQATFPGEFPNAYAAAGFIAGEVFTEALVRAGENPTVESLIKGLETMKGWSGIISPAVGYKPYDVKDENCRVGLQAMYVMTVVDGLWQKTSEWIFK